MITPLGERNDLRDEPSGLNPFFSVAAKISHNALIAMGLAGRANVAAMQNQPVMGIFQKGFRDVLQQLFLHGQRRFTGRQACSVRNPENMGVNRDGGFAKCGIEYDIGGFAPHARECLQRFSLSRHFSVVLVEQDAASLDDIGCLGVEQANGANVIAQRVLAHVENGLWRIGHGVQAPGRPVHADVGYFAVPAVFVIGWIFFLIEGIGDYMQDPFEDNRNSTPMFTLARMLEIDLKEILGEAELPPRLQPEEGVLM